MTIPQPKHGIQPTTLKYLVFAGSFREFRVWALSNSIKNGEALYVAHPTNLSTLPPNVDYRLCFVGTFHMRTDKDEILEAAHERFPNTRFTDGVWLV